MISSRSHNRMSSATWSLRDRPVCSFAPAGVRRVNSASMFMWTSSSSGFHWNLPASISRPIASRPFTMARNSALVSTPIFCNIVAWAIEPRMSCCHSRQSKEMDSVNCATSAPGPPANRPLRETGECLFHVQCRRMCVQSPQKSRRKPGNPAARFSVGVGLRPGRNPAHFNFFGLIRLDSLCPGHP